MSSAADPVIQPAYDMLVAEWSLSTRNTFGDLLHASPTKYALGMVPRISRALKSAVLSGKQLQGNGAGLIIIRYEDGEQIVSSFRADDYIHAEKINQDLCADILEHLPRLEEILDDIARVRAARIPTLPKSYLELIAAEFKNEKEKCVLSPLSHYRLYSIWRVLDADAESDLVAKRLQDTAKEFKRAVMSRHLVSDNLTGSNDALVSATAGALLQALNEFTSGSRARDIVALLRRWEI